jgi:hypothetical protein
MMTSQISVLTDSELDSVSGGTDAKFAVHFSFFGVKVGITVTDTPNGPMTCTSVRDSSGKSSHSCTVPV